MFSLIYLERLLRTPPDSWDMMARHTLITMTDGVNRYPEGSLFMDCQGSQLKDIETLETNRTAWRNKVATLVWCKCFTVPLDPLCPICDGALTSLDVTIVGGVQIGKNVARWRQCPTRSYSQPNAKNITNQWCRRGLSPDAWIASFSNMEVGMGAPTKMYIVEHNHLVRASGQCRISLYYGRSGTCHGPRALGTPRTRGTICCARFPNWCQIVVHTARLCGIASWVVATTGILHCILHNILQHSHGNIEPSYNLPVT